MFRIDLATFVLVFLSGCASLGPLSPLAPVERALIYHPQTYPDGNWRPIGLDYEDAWFESADGTRLHGWFAPHDNPKAVALFLHGNAGNITGRAPILRALHDRHDVAVMTFDYRGYGRSEGKPNEKGILRDARAARAWLAKRTGVQESDIVIMGRSLGGGVAVDLAANDGARGLVLSSTFTSLPAVGAHLIPWMPTRLVMTHRLDSLSKIADYHGPLLHCHGDADKVIPYEMGKTLFAAAPGPKKFVTISGAGHNDPWSQEFHVALGEFIASLNSPPVPRYPVTGY